ncbi:glutathione peroxidase [Arhodomonas sp. AD133]|uniref:glutathione peroxidase n=1 Tax=Arhodomonas sp. AD133 TaxID=3415009 RepID=UPI003EB893CF
MDNREGLRVPEVTFRVRRDNAWQSISSDDIFTARTVVVFALPGAYTPTCSASHLPRYNELAPVLKANGVDEIVCLSVNDTFVMNEWGKDQEAENVTLLPDGNGEFTDGMGMLVDKSELGFGKRSWRYSMLVRDGVIEKQFIEPEKPGDPFEVSDADTMLNYINAAARPPEPVTLFTRRGCPHCARAQDLLDQAGIAYESIELARPVTSRSLRAVSGRNTTPQVFIGGHHIGGADELERYLRTQQRSAA